MNDYFPTINNWLINPHLVASEWFVPFVFATALGMHTVMFLSSEKRIPDKQEMKWGVLGGLFNGFRAFLYFYAIETATLNETGFIFAVFSISTITACNLWGQWLYNEQVNWKANAVCLLGIFIASLS